MIKYLDVCLIVLLGAASFAIAIYAMNPNVHVTIQYDCRLADISPDYPPAVKNACHKLLQPKVVA
jgi:hypothetical protein